MQIIADQEIPFVSEAFSTIGETRLVNGYDFSPSVVRDADILVIRSITKIDETLLEDSRVRLVATVTSGTDHIVIPYLNQRNIGLVTSAGCNAEAVVEYILAALSQLALKKSFRFEEKTLGIIGVGNVGGLLQKKAERLGMECVLCDPPKKELTGDTQLVPLDELLERADIISLNVPLTFESSYPTFQIANEDFFQKIRRNAILVNTSRGAVIKESALVEYRSRLSSVVLDVWPNEPDIRPELLRLVDIATPHIAGYTYEAKIKATEMAYFSVCRFVDFDPVWSAKEAANFGLTEIKMDEVNELLYHTILQAYPIRKDDESLRKQACNGEAKQFFNQLRKNYLLRREFTAFTIRSNNRLDAQLVNQLRNLEFLLPQEQQK